MELNSVSRFLQLNQTQKSSGDFFPPPKFRPNLISPDQLLMNPRNFGNPAVNLNFSENSSLENRLQQIQSGTYRHAHGEWSAGVREIGGTSNRSPRIDQYFRNGGFNPGSAGWCGFFVAFNYSQFGFKEPSKLAGMEKARDFFLYRSYTDRSKEKNSELDNLRFSQQQKGSQRQFFLLNDSPSIKYLSSQQKYFSHFDLRANTFQYHNLPVRGGDTILFYTGKPGGHVGMVASYDQSSGILKTIEGNTSGKGPDGKNYSGTVAYKTYDLKNPSVRAKISGFGRPSVFDFQ